MLKQKTIGKIMYFIMFIPMVAADVIVGLCFGVLKQAVHILL
jgi:hypothetical protein